MSETVNSSDWFEEYLLHEYDNVAEAHFKSIEAFSSFFKYYLILMAIPWGLGAVLYKVPAVQNDGGKQSTVSVVFIVLLCVIGLAPIFETTS